MGGSMFIHAFGAYFGLGVAKMLGNTVPPTVLGSNSKRALPWTEFKLNRSTPISDLFAMIGALLDGRWEGEGGA
jgi:hypothetical protein